MKSTRVLRIAAICVGIIMLCASIVPSFALYNDITFESYNNMAADSAVPNLFRNDSVFPSYKKYPPVISDGIEYVPLEIFYGLSGVKINYSEDGTNFYIQNKKTNKYISFNIPNNYAVAGNGNIYEALVPTFYNVPYVPLRMVCNTTGIGCDSYNDGVNRLYVIKVFTAPGLSAKELIKIHAPGIYGSEEEKETPPEVSDDTPTPPAKEEFPSRDLYLMFDSENFEKAGRTLDTLDRLGIRALFEVTGEDILNYPDTVRRIITSGHTICLDIPEDGGEIYSENGLENAVKMAEDALYEVAKTKTRLVNVKTTSPEKYKESNIEERLSLLGVAIVPQNINSQSDSLSQWYVGDSLTAKIKNLYGGTKRLSNAYIKIHHTDAGQSAMYKIFELAMNNPSVHTRLYTEVDS